MPDCLVLVDVQNDYFPGGRMELAGTEAAAANMALKVPPHLYEATLRFYRDVLGLREIATHAPSVGFEIGANQLWIPPTMPVPRAPAQTPGLEDS